MITATSPPARTGGRIAYDGARRRIVLYGGTTTSINFGDTWEYDGTNWTATTPVSSPQARHNHGLAYHAARQRVVLFGGDTFRRRNRGVLLGDTWEYDGKVWTRVSGRAAPSVRAGFTLAYDAARQRTVLHGGYDRSGTLADTWSYGNPGLTLSADTPTISLSVGGTQKLTLAAGAAMRNRRYWIFGSLTGTMPGIDWLGIHVPVVPDAYTQLAIGAVSSPMFTGFAGTLDARGAGRASLYTPKGLSIPSVTLYHAYLAYDATTGAVYTASNAVPVLLR